MTHSGIGKTVISDLDRLACIECEGPAGWTQDICSLCIDAANAKADRRATAFSAREMRKEAIALEARAMSLRTMADLAGA